MQKWLSLLLFGLLLFGAPVSVLADDASLSVVLPCLSRGTLNELNICQYEWKRDDHNSLYVSAKYSPKIDAWNNNTKTCTQFNFGGNYYPFGVTKGIYGGAFVGGISTFHSDSRMYGIGGGFQAGIKKALVSHLTLDIGVNSTIGIYPHMGTFDVCGVIAIGYSW